MFAAWLKPQLPGLVAVLSLWCWQVICQLFCCQAGGVCSTQKPSSHCPLGEHRSWWLSSFASSQKYFGFSSLVAKIKIISSESSVLLEFLASLLGAKAIPGYCKERDMGFVFFLILILLLIRRVRWLLWIAHLLSRWWKSVWCPVVLTGVTNLCTGWKMKISYCHSRLCCYQFCFQCSVVLFPVFQYPGAWTSFLNINALFTCLWYIKRVRTYCTVISGNEAELTWMGGWFRLSDIFSRKWSIPLTQVHYSACWNRGHDLWIFWALLTPTCNIAIWIGNWGQEDWAGERVQSPGSCRVRRRQKAEPGKSGRPIQNTMKN